MQEYTKFLKKHRKNNGDKLLPSTIEVYTKFIDKYETDILQYDDDLELVKYFNKEIIKKPSMIMYSAFRMYLFFIGHDIRDKNDECLKNLRTPLILGKGTESSVRKLQEEVISEQELRILYKNVNKYWQMVMSLMYDTACRKAELLQLRFNSIIYKDPNNPKDKKDIESGIYAEVNIVGKGFKQRLVYLTKNTVDLIKQYSTTKKEEDYIIRFYQKCGKLYVNQEFEFWNRIIKITNKFLDRHVHPHTYRHCCYEDSEVLTVDGWKSYNELKVGTKIFTYNIDKDIIELLPTTKVNVYDIEDEELVHIKNRYIDALITKEHNNVVNVCVEKYKDKKSFDVWKGWELLTYDDICKIPNKRGIKFKTSSYKFEGKSIGRTMSGIIGWILSDATKNKKNGAITIFQSLTANEKKCEIIEELLIDSKIPFTKKIDKPRVNNLNGKTHTMVIFHFNVIESKRFDKYITKDRKPKWSLLELPYEELLAIYNNMMLGDGTRNQEYTCQDKEMIDFFCALCSLIGKRVILCKGIHNHTGLEKCRTYVSDNTTANIYKKQVTMEKHTGKVWCPSTKNGTFICRRNENVYITGNTKLQHMANEGVPILQIASYAGHSDIKTTMKYVHNSTFQGKQGWIQSIIEIGDEK